MKFRNWFWGLFFLVAAVFVVASQTGAFGQLGIWSVGATVVLIAIMIESMIHLNFFGVLLPLAFLYMIYQVPLGLMEVSIWLLFLAAIFASIGLHLIFRPHMKRWEKRCERWESRCERRLDHGHGDFSRVSESVDDNNPFVKSSFSSSGKYLHADSLKSGQFFVSFGELEVYFDQAKLDPTGAEVYVDCSFGSLKLFIPRDWNVIDKVSASLGGVDDDKRYNKPTENAPTLTLTGNVSFGSLEVHYI